MNVKQTIQSGISMSLNNRMEIIDELTMHHDKKDTVDFGDTMVGFCVLCLYKPNRRKFQLTQEKQMNILQSTLLGLLFQCGFIWCVNDGLSPFDPESELMLALYTKDENPK